MARRIDHLGLHSAMADRLLPVLAGAMSFLAVLVIAGALTAAALSAQWQNNTAASLTVQVPDPVSPAASGNTNRAQAVLAVLTATPGVSAARALTGDEVNQLLKPWFGQDIGQLSLPVPAVITARLNQPDLPDALAASLNAAAPGTLAATGANWAAKVTALTASLQACAEFMLLIVAAMAAALVMVATRAGLAQRREAIGIIHGLGALDSYIAARFAFHATRLVTLGSIGGTVCALPVLFWLARLAAPFAGAVPHPGAAALPAALWLALPAIPVITASIGWATTQLTVRGWLRALT